MFLIAGENLFQFSEKKKKMLWTVIVKIAFIFVS